MLGEALDPSECPKFLCGSYEFIPAMLGGRRGLIEPRKW